MVSAKITSINKGLQLFLLVFIVLLSLPFGYHAFDVGQIGLITNDFSATSLGLNQQGNRLTGSGIGLHMLLGGFLTLLAPIQVLLGWKKKWLVWHKRLGYLIFGAAILTGVGGLTYIFLHQTTGGIVMDIAFSLYGVLMIIAAVQTVRHARNHQLEQHEEWSLRLFVLAIGSWFYRVCYGAWFFYHRAPIGHTDNFQGTFDYFMDFAFYLLPLLALEIYFRTIKTKQLNIPPLLGSFLMLSMIAFMIVGFIVYWG